MVPLRLLDLLAGLSRLADLGFGLQAGESLRSGVLAARLANELGLPDEAVRAALLTALLQHVGCTGYAHETARLFGDELATNVAAGRTDLADPRDLFATFLPTLSRGRGPVGRTRVIVTALLRGARFGEAYTTAACEVGRHVAQRLDLSADVQDGLFHAYELWQGGGAPAGLAGDDIPIAARIARLTGIAALFDSLGGAEDAVAALRARAGGMLDPSLVDAFVARSADLLDEVGTGDPHTMLLGLEPRPVAHVSDPGLVGVAEVFADLADLKSPYLHGHSREVARLARDAGERLGLAADALHDLEAGALLHDVGRVAVSTGLWEKPGPLTGSEWEQVRLHAYHSERILAGSGRLSRLVPAVGMHHERLDGAGYHRSTSGDAIPVAARVVAAADAYQAMTRARPHRPALPAADARDELLREARRGAMDADAVAAVLGAAGHTEDAVPTPGAPAGLTPREVEVVRLVAEGCSNAEIADRLVISRRTAEHHVQHIYAKLGASSRAAAAVFAMEHGLYHGGGDG